MELSLKNLILAGIGTVAYTYEKSVEMVDELVKKGELTINQGKQINEELKRKIDEKKAQNAGSGSVTLDSLKEMLAGLNLATKDDLEELKERMNKLENK
jgi:polyhydroxyalkanoate synthesis regulator phasin